MDATFGGVHFIIDSGGFHQLPSSTASSLRTSAPDTIVPPITSVGLPGSSNGSSQRIFGSREEQRIFAAKKKNEPRVASTSVIKDVIA
jgi:hypothetical protein